MCETPGSKALSVMKDIQKSCVEFKIPQYPKRKKQKILTEEKYIEELSKIIQRDFFPDLEKLKAQNEYLDAIGKNDTVKLEEIYSKYTGKKLGFNSGQSPATFETPASSSSIITNSKTNISNFNIDSSSDSLSGKHSLDSFLNKYTSEDNSSFQEIIDAAEEKLKQKFAVLYNHEKLSVDKLSKALKLPSIEQQFNDNDSIKKIETWSYKNKNYIMYIPDGVKLTKEEQMEMINRKQEIAYTNTRLHTNPFDENQNKETLIELAKVQAKQLTGKIGVDGNLVKRNCNSSPQVRGHIFVKTPSPSPGDICSPLMTWGEIEGTPFRLDGSDTPIRPLAGPSFRINETTRREAIALELAEKAGERKRNQKQKALSTARKSIGSPYLRCSSSADRLSTLSPAARGLVTTKFGSSLLTPSPLVLSKSPSTIVRRKTPSAFNRQFLSENLLSPLSNVEKSDLTNDLLKIPSKRQKASDFF